MTGSSFDDAVDHDFTSRPRILVVDDEESVRKSVVRSLRSEGYDITCAASGEEAVALAQPPRSFDVIISDIVMRGMSGVALAERVRLGDPTVQVILISGYPRTHLSEESPMTSQFELLEKPFTPSQLTARVRETVQRSARAACKP